MGKASPRKRARKKRAAPGRPVRVRSRARKTPLEKSQQLAREIEAWQKRLAPKLPHIDPHDLHLILWSILRRKYGGERYFFLKRREGGGYVF
jgi:hypothetical protein